MLSFKNKSGALKKLVCFCLMLPLLIISAHAFSAPANTNRHSGDIKITEEVNNAWAGKQNLINHWCKHKGESKGSWDSVQTYGKAAMDFKNEGRYEPETETFISRNNRFYMFNKKSNIFSVLTEHPDRGGKIITLFKPNGGSKYWEKQKALNNISEDWQDNSIPEDSCLR